MKHTAFPPDGSRRNAVPARTAPRQPPVRASRFPILALLSLFLLPSAASVSAAPEPITYSVAFTYRSNSIAEVTAVVPTENRDAVELMLPIWSPGYYRVENYADNVRSLSAHTLDGEALHATLSRSNRWRVETKGNPAVRVSYKLVCNQRTVTRNSVDPNYAVLNGGATFITLVDSQSRPHEITLNLPPTWEHSACGLPPIDGKPHAYRAEDYHALVDSPILAGRLQIREFDVNGTRHFLVNAGYVSDAWDNDRAVDGLEKLVQEHHAFWGGLPFDRYFFMNVFRRSGGGLEHRNSTLLAVASSARGPSDSWYALACHEYFHAFNVKRLRPVEFNTFDYESPPRTTALWISEGLTTYYGILLVARAGLMSPEWFLERMSAEIALLQNSPGRLHQSLHDASLNVWESSNSGMSRGNPARTISYYNKGLIAGLLLDAKIQYATDGRKCLDDVMRLACARYSGATGFTADQFRALAEEVAGTDLTEWFRRTVSSTEELDYSEMLDWYGLEFGPSDDPNARWQLTPRSDASEAQQERLRRLTSPTRRSTDVR